MTKATIALPQHLDAFIQSKLPQGLQDTFERIKEINDTEQLANLDMRLASAQKIARLIRGILFQRWEELAGANSLAEYLREIGMPRSTAYDYMNEARAYLLAGTVERCEKLSELNALVVRELPKLPADSLHTLIDGGEVNGITLADSRTMPIPDFRRAITAGPDDMAAIEENKRLAAELAEQREKNQIAQMELAALKEQAKMRNWPLPMAVAGGQIEVLTEKTLVLQEAMAEVIRQLEHELDVYAATEMPPGGDSALAALGLLLRVRVGSALVMLQDIYDTICHSSYGNDIEIHAVHISKLMLEDDERRVIAEARAILQQDLEFQLDMIREKATPRGRGRPRKEKA